MPGVVRTRVGYTGGTSPKPTYRNLGDHTESLQVDFDPEQITYAELLKVFWASHDGCRSGGSTQYMSILFVHDAEQRAVAESSRDAEAKRRELKIRTPIRDAGTFHSAEDYHQKHRLRRNADLSKVFETLYPDAVAFRDSTSAARVNGWLAGYGTATEYRAARGRLGLPPKALERLDALFAEAAAE